jgi:phenylacetic acid degradation operon negative regulatory protein
VSGGMQARSALFDLYGDHLRAHGGRAPVAALVRLLAPLDIGAPAVRTAVSRMVRQGWLHPLRLASGPGYLITPRAAKRLEEAGARIYRTTPSIWDGTFDVIIAEPMLRGDRMRIANNLAYLGYGVIGDCTWVATKPSAEAEGVLTDAGVRFERFISTHTGGLAGARALVSRAWDLDGIGQEYRNFVKALTPVVTDASEDGDPEIAYTARFQLVHAWRTFLFRDPGLPAELLPERWPGHDAAAFFDHHAARLRPAADRFVEGCLAIQPSGHGHDMRTAGNDVGLGGPGREPRIEGMT